MVKARIAARRFVLSLQFGWSRKMIVKWLLTLLVVALAAGPAALLARDENVGWIRSIAQADPNEQLYPVNINRINGKNPMTSHRYTVDAGEATIEVSLVFSAQWAPRLRPIENDIFSMEFKINVEPGKTYVISGKVNPDATKEEMDAGSFWKPHVVESADG
jgi:hypothetical protein